MKRIGLLIVVLFLLLSSVSMGASIIFEDDLDQEDYMDNPLWSNFSFYNVKEDNFVFDGDNGYYNGKWTEGASAFYLDPVFDYSFSFDFKSKSDSNVNSNCYKSAIAIRVEEEKFVFEADNGDKDPTSFLGPSGIYFYCYDNIVEVAIHSKEKGGIAGPINKGEGAARRKTIDKPEDRYFGVYSTSYIIELDEAINFNNFTQVKIVDRQNLIDFYIGEDKICQLELSDEYEVHTLISDDCPYPNKFGPDAFYGTSYKTIVLKDNEDKELMTVKESVVAIEGVIGFLNRANAFYLDNIRIEYNYEPTPGPTKDATKEPTKTVKIQEPKATSEPIEKKESNVLPYVFVGLALLVTVLTVFILIKTKKKHQ